MMRRFAFLLLFAFAIPLSAAAQTAAQPPLPTKPLTIVTTGGVRHVFKVEVANTPNEQRTGLMFRHHVAADSGMLFPMSTPHVSEMWMKNTMVPLDMVFIDARGVIVHIVENTVPQSLRIISSHRKVLATLELQGGITAKLNITVGDKVLFPLFHTAH